MTGVSTLSQIYKTTSTVTSSTCWLYIQKRYTLTHFELDLVFVRQKIISSYVVYIHLSVSHAHLISFSIHYTTQHDNNNVIMTLHNGSPTLYSLIYICHVYMCYIYIYCIWPRTTAVSIFCAMFQRVVASFLWDNVQVLGVKLTWRVTLMFPIKKLYIAMRFKRPMS